MPHITASSPPMRQGHDAFMGISKPGTRVGTPFNGFSIPGTPPDFFLHTRNSPNISQDLWQNYQPDQLFPPDSMAFDLQSPRQQMVDPMMNAAQPPPPPPTHRASFSGPLPPMSAPPLQQMGPQMQGNSMPMQYQQSQAWAQMPGPGMDHRQSMATLIGESGQSGADDTWSNSSTGGPIVPTTLNVGDWSVTACPRTIGQRTDFSRRFEFFGLPNNGEMSALHAQY